MYTWRHSWLFAESACFAQRNGNPVLSRYFALNSLPALFFGSNPDFLGLNPFCWKAAALQPDQGKGDGPSTANGPSLARHLANEVNGMRRIVVFLGLAVAVTCPKLANADIVYSSVAQNNVPGGPYNYVPLAYDGTPGWPGGSEIGNTIVLGGAARDLTTVDIGLFSGGGSGSFTLYLYGGDDPNSATFLGSESTNIGGGIYPTAPFDFTSLGIVLPDVVTFIVTGQADAGHGPLSGFAPTTGTATDAMWYGSGAGTATPAFVSNSAWAVADSGGYATNLIAAQFNAVQVSSVPTSAAVPEPTTFALLASMLLGLGIACRLAFRRS
jgi:hypothetical protein